METSWIINPNKIVHMFSSCHFNESSLPLISPLNRCPSKWYHEFIWNCKHSHLGILCCDGKNFENIWMWMRTMCKCAKIEIYICCEFSSAGLKIHYWSKRAYLMLKTVVMSQDITHVFQKGGPEQATTIVCTEHHDTLEYCQIFQ